MSRVRGTAIVHIQPSSQGRRAHGVPKNRKNQTLSTQNLVEEPFYGRVALFGSRLFMVMKPKYMRLMCNPNPQVLAHRNLSVNRHLFQSFHGKNDADLQNGLCNTPRNLFVRKVLPYRGIAREISLSNVQILGRGLRS